MSTKALLMIYIKQGKEYRKIFQKTNTNGAHTSKIKRIDEKLKRAEKLMKNIC